MTSHRVSACQRHGALRVLRVILALAAAFLVCGAGPAMAGDDHDRARQALEAGEVLPLKTILERVGREFPGEILDVELERMHDDHQERWIYEIKLLRSGGSLVKIKVDASNGNVIGKKTRPGNKN